MIKLLRKKQIANTSGGIFECHCTPFAITTTNSIEECAEFCCDFFLKSSYGYTAYPYNPKQNTINERGARSGYCFKPQLNYTTILYYLPHGLLKE